jgi:MerR family transcriptional regulator, thiopeptide resistance regulator
MALTAGKAAKLYGISRTALLYYDEIGLVSPSDRSASGYRLYSEADLKRLQTVIAYRDAGICLDDVSRLLSGSGGSLEAVLLKKLNELNNELIAVKKRQAAVIGIIQGLSKGDGTVDKQGWHEALEEAGITGSAADKLHDDFEEHSPQLHAGFLQALGFDKDEIKMIRVHHSHN